MTTENILSFEILRMPEKNVVKEILIKFTPPSPLHLHFPH